MLQTNQTKRRPARSSPRPQDDHFHVQARVPGPSSAREQLNPQLGGLREKGGVVLGWVMGILATKVARCRGLGAKL